MTRLLVKRCLNLIYDPRDEMAHENVLPGFNPTLLLVLNLIGTFVFGLSGGMAGVRAHLDVFGAIVLAVTVGIAGGTIRDLMIGIPPTTFREWYYLAAASGGGLVAVFAHPAVGRMTPLIDTLDAAGLGLFCVTGAAIALANHLGVIDSILLGALTGIGGGMVRDILLRQVPTVLRGGLYAIPALVGAAIVVVGYRLGNYTVLFPIVGAAVCFALRMLGLRYGLGLPSAADVAVTGLPRVRRGGEGSPPL